MEIYNSNKVDEVYKYRESLTNYVNKLRDNAGDNKLEELAEMRKLKSDTIKKAGIFYIKDPAEMIVPEYIDNIRDFGVIAINNRPMYTERYVIPIYDTLGMVMALVGYKYGVNEKYMYANTKYFNRGDALYGLQDIDKCIRTGCTIVVEGLMDRIRVTELGFDNCLATCGADKSWERMLVFSNLRKCVFIPDRDRAGMLTSKHWVCDTMVRLILPEQFKDIDEFARQNNSTESFCRDMLQESCRYMTEEVATGYREEIDIAGLFQ